MRKKTILCASTIFLFLATSASAKIWQVNNNPGVTADFTTLQNANDNAAVMDGDTLYVAGSPTSYGSLSLTKELIIIGPGYFLDENPDTQAVTEAAKTGPINFKAGSDDSVIAGLTIHVTAPSDTVAVLIDANVDSITITRNMITSDTSHTILINESALGILIAQNYIVNSASPSGGVTVGVAFDATVTITNNYIERTETGFAAIDTLAGVGGAADLEVRNNVIKGDLILKNTDFRNNIIRQGSITLDVALTNTVEFNLGPVTTVLPAGVGNINIVDPDAEFIGPGSTDGQWQLSPGSNSVNAGDPDPQFNDLVNGTRNDMGMFGGMTPYILSGLPPIPAIYSYQAQTKSATTLPITVKIKSHN